jgi:endo-1,4-beta-D-glucanase Y
MRASAYLRSLALAVPLIALGCAAVGCGASPSNPTGTGGSGNSAGDTGTGGTGTGGTAPAACGPQTPPPAAGGLNYPFPQHRLSSYCSYPTNCNDADVMTSWNTYKTKMITSSGAGGNLRVQRPENANDTVSEGIAYGMEFAVYMGDKPTFDGLWAYAKAHRNGNGLMNWRIDANGGTVGQGAATDADEDMGFALIMADKQWGGYASDTNALLSAILSREVDSSNNLRPDDSGGTQDTNPSYFAPAYYKIFQTYTGQSRWSQVVDATYTVLNRCAHATTGLVPDWCNPSTGAATRSSRYYYDATRTPFRIAQDACWNNESRAIAYLAKLAAFFNGLGPTNIKDGYNLDGTMPSANFSMAFEGPAATSAMPSGTMYTNLMFQIYARVSATAKTGTSTSYNYYSASWGLMTLMLMTGNMTNLAAL